jgi:uncharacterized protein DUF222
MRTTTLQGLESELAQEQAHINAAVARWPGLLAEYDDRSDVGGDRFERWVAWRFGVSYWEAAELVRLARALRELPHIRDAFARGELTYTKVRALTRVATPSCEERLLSLASVLTAPQLDRALRLYQRVSTAQARRQHELEYVNYYWDDDGSLVLHARLASEDGTVLVRAGPSMRRANASASGDAATGRPRPARAMRRRPGRSRAGSSRRAREPSRRCSTSPTAHSPPARARSRRQPSGRAWSSVSTPPRSPTTPSPVAANSTTAPSSPPKPPGGTAATPPP